MKTKDYNVTPYTETNDFRTYRVRAGTALQAKIIAYLIDCKLSGKDYEFKPVYWDVSEPPGIPKTYTIDDVDYKKFLKLLGSSLAKEFNNK
jgi:hypothetical protein